MPRIQGVEPEQAGFFTKLSYRIVRKEIGKVTGTAQLIEPVKIMAHHPRILLSVGLMDYGLEKSTEVKPRYKHLGMIQASRLVGYQITG